jgi:hypothetical protein
MHEPIVIDTTRTILRQLDDDVLERLWQSLNAQCDHASSAEELANAENAIAIVAEEGDRRRGR